MTLRRLSVVTQDEELVGAGPPAFERLARTATPGSTTHRGLVAIAITLASSAARSCVPPSAQLELVEALETGRLWIQNAATEGDVKGARARCFGAVSAIEESTARAVVAAREHVGHGASCPLDPHADHVVDRYVRLGAHFAVSAICHSLDAVVTPDQSLKVLEDLEGARAYQLTGLGSARHPAFRKAAWNQAEWESARSPSADRSMLAVQVFHEYLGGRWRAQAEASRIETAAFLNWALSATAATSST